MKAHIITIHSIHNFGSVFQAMALEKYCAALGYDTKIIDYRPEYNLAGRRRWMTFLGKAINMNAYLTKKKKFNGFIDEHMHLTKRYATELELKKAYAAYDENLVLIAGGDQLWNPYHYCGKDHAYRLTFANKAQPKVAYGTSLGKSTFTEEESRELAQDLPDFRAIGVREGSSVALLQQAGIKPVQNVCDPVLLWDRTFYQQFIKPPKIKEKYIFVYLADKSELLSRTLDALKAKYGYKVVHVCGFRKKFDYDYMIKNEGPEDVLSLLYHAEFVVSASFHATLFSLLFNKNFITLLPGTNTNARVIELLEKVDLSDRLVRAQQDIPSAVEQVDFTRSNEILDTYIAESKAYLQQSLEQR